VKKAWDVLWLVITAVFLLTACAPAQDDGSAAAVGRYLLQVAAPFSGVGL
jgi:hypothetical protein